MKVFLLNLVQFISKLVYVVFYDVTKGEYPSTRKEGCNMSKYHNIPGIGFPLIAPEKHKIWKKIQVIIIAQQEIFQYELFFMFRLVLPFLTISDKVLLSNANT